MGNENKRPEEAAQTYRAVLKIDSMDVDARVDLFGKGKPHPSRLLAL